MSSFPLFTSPGTAKSLWQEYRIYEDHLELEYLFGRIVVSFHEIERLEVYTSDVLRLLSGKMRLKGFRLAGKLDWANFLEHIVLDKRHGWIRRILFTPEDPTSFKAAFDKAMAAHKTS